MALTVTPRDYFSGTITATAGGASAQTLFTKSAAASSSDIDMVTNLIICNTDSVARTVTLSKVPNSSGVAGTEAQANRFISALSIPAGKSIPMDLRLILTSQNDTLQAFASAASVINVFFTGIRQQ